MTNSLSALLRALIAPTFLSNTPVKRPNVSGASPAGMVQSGSLTFSIWRLARNHYGVVRLLDDQYLGSFSASPRITVSPEPGVEAELLVSVARTAKRLARTTAITARQA